MTFFSNLFSNNAALPKIDEEELGKIVLEAARSPLKEYRERARKEHLDACILSEKCKEERQIERNTRR
jgi:hypothetical protein